MYGGGGNYGFPHTDRSNALSVGGSLNTCKPVPCQPAVELQVPAIQPDRGILKPGINPVQLSKIQYFLLCWTSRFFFLSQTKSISNYISILGYPVQRVTTLPRKFTSEQCCHPINYCTYVCGSTVLGLMPCWHIDTFSWHHCVVLETCSISAPSTVIAPSLTSSGHLVRVGSQ